MQEQARNQCGELSNEGKDIKRKYGKSIYRNMSKEDKRKQREHQKNYRNAKKWFYFFICIILKNYISKGVLNFDDSNVKKVHLTVLSIQLM